MKLRLPAKMMTTALLALWLMNGCADQAVKSAGSKASPAALAAIDSASAAVKAAKANDWIWRDTEDYLAQAQQAADKGDNQTAITLAEQARFEAEAAVIQFNHEKDNPRGL